MCILQSKANEDLISIIFPSWTRVVKRMPRLSKGNYNWKIKFDAKSTKIPSSSQDNAQTPPFNHRSCSCQEQTRLSQPAGPDPVNGHSSQSTSILVFHCLFPRIWLPPTSPQTDKTSVVEMSSVSTRIHKCRWLQPSTLEVQAATNLLFPNWKP